MIETLLLSITSFVGTNIDDILINTFLFSEARTKADVRSIVCGKYLGTGTLTFLSILCALGLQFLSQRYIGFLGFVPICLGVREIIQNRRPEEAHTSGSAKKTSNNMLNAALITMANGADNIGVYIPLFAGFTLWQTALTVCVFCLFTAVWCFLGKALANLPFLRNLLAKHKPVIVPTVYIALGIYILWKNLL